jgi:hypothetical protein
MVSSRTLKISFQVLLALVIMCGSLWLGAVGFIIGSAIAAMLRIYRREFIAYGVSHFCQQPRCFFIFDTNEPGLNNY